MQSRQTERSSNSMVPFLALPTKQNIGDKHEGTIHFPAGFSKITKGNNMYIQCIQPCFCILVFC